MTIYGYKEYNTFTYGIESLTEFLATPFFAEPYNYGVIQVGWGKPSGDWTDFMLVRNSYGFPLTPDDGDAILTTTFAGHDSLSIPIIDDGIGFAEHKLTQGRAYYYSIFVKKTSDGSWRRAGNTRGVSVKDFGTAKAMYEYMPMPYKSLSASKIVSTDSDLDYTNTDLYSFLSLFAFEYDLIKTLAENAKHRYDLMNLDGRLVPALMNQFGFPFEPDLGIQQGRRLLQYAAEIYSKRGSRAGIKTFVKAFTNFPCSIGPIKNLFLTNDDASFERSVGFWGNTTNATLTSISGASESPAKAPYAESTAPVLHPNLQKGMMKAVAAASGDMVMYCGKTKPTTQGIPVTAGNAYAFTIKSLAKTTARSVSTSIYWYDQLGTFISSVTPVSTNNATGTSWVTTTVVTGTAPSGAVYAVPYVKVTGCASGEVHYFDCAQFEAGSTATDFVDARRIDIYLQPDRLNYIKNPSFASVTTGWTATNGAITSSTTKHYIGTNSAKLVVGSSATVAGISVTAGTTYGPAVTPGSSYAFSMYAIDVDTAKSYKAQLLWYTSGGTLISTTSGDVTALSTTDWTRLTVIGTAPATAAYVVPQVMSSSAFVSGDSGKIVYFDGALFEPGESVNPYFDGTYGYLESYDMVWEGGNSTTGRGMYYRNLYNTAIRLRVVMADFLPYDATHAIFTGVIV